MAGRELYDTQQCDLPMAGWELYDTQPCDLPMASWELYDTQQYDLPMAGRFLPCDAPVESSPADSMACLSLQTYDKL